MRFFLLTLICTALLPSVSVHAQTIFSPEVEFPEGPRNDRGGFTIDAGDMDGDGDEDVIAAYGDCCTGQGDHILLYENNGTGVWNTPEIILSDIDRVYCAELVDMDGDDDLDVFFMVLGNFPGNIIGWISNDGTGHFGEMQVISTAVASARVARTGDVDGDGDLDVVAYNNFSFPESNYELVWIENEGSENFGEPQSIYDEFGLGQPQSLSLDDMDNDGDLDIVCRAGQSLGLNLFINTGGADFASPVQLSSSSNGAEVTDVDLDGDLDIVFTRFQLRWMENMGNAVFVEHIENGAVRSTATSIFSFDADNDADPDIVTYDSGRDALFLYINDGAGNFTSDCMLSSYKGTWVNDFASTDMDGDGDLELLCAQGYGIPIPFSWYDNWLDEEITVAKGRIFLDMDNNGHYDGPIYDLAFAGYPVTIQPENVVVYTDILGTYYYTTTTPGTYTVHVDDPLTYLCNGLAETQRVQPVEVPSSFQYEDFQCVEQDYIYQLLSSDCRRISGRVFYDINENGLEDSEEPGRGGIVVTANGYGLTISNIDGRFSLAVPRNDTVIVGLDLANSLTNSYCDVTNIPLSQTYLPDDGSYTIPPAYLDVDTLLFGVYDDSWLLFDAGIYTLAMQYGDEPGKLFRGWLDFKTIGNITEACTLRIVHDPRVNMYNSTIPPMTVGNTYVEWVFPVGTAPERFCMEMDWEIDDVVPIGDTLRWTATYACPPATDACALNDIRMTEVVMVEPGGRRAEETVKLYSKRPTGTMPEILMEGDDVLSYVIYFQNPLDVTAHNVTVFDTLPNALDLSTISYPFSSFEEFNYTIDEAGVTVFNFEGIDLSPVADDELNSYGFVQFNIRLKDDLPDGTVIPNRATAYFNGTLPAASNEVIHRLGMAPVSSNPVSLAQALEVFPNPFSEQVFVRLPDVTSGPFDIRIYDLRGHEVRRYEQIRDHILAIDRGRLTTGLYMLLVQGSGRSGSTFSRKLVVH